MTETNRADDGGLAASVVIVTRQRESSLRRSVLTLLEQADPSWELIVVDDAPRTSATIADFVAQHRGRFTYVRRNVGSVPPNENVGITLARGDIIIFIDDDTEPGPDFVANHVRNYADPRVGGVAGRIRQHDYPEWEPTPKRDMGFNAFWHQHFNWRERRPVAMARGCNMSFRRDVLFAVGGCDERYCAESLRWDTDLAYCVRKAGYTIMYDPDAWLTHHYSPRGGCRAHGRDLKCVQTYYQNNFYFLFKHRPPFLSALYYTFAVFLAGCARKAVLRSPSLWWRIPRLFFAGMVRGKRLASSEAPARLPANLSSVDAAGPQETLLSAAIASAGGAAH